MSQDQPVLLQPPQTRLLQLEHVSWASQVCFPGGRCLGVDVVRRGAASAVQVAACLGAMRGLACWRLQRVMQQEDALEEAAQGEVQKGATEDAARRQGR